MELKGKKHKIRVVQAETCLNPIISISRYFAIAPFTYTTRGNVTVYSFSPNYAIYSVLVALILGCLGVFGTASEALEDEDKKVRMIGTMTTYVTCIDFGGVITSNVINTLSIVAQRSHFLSIVAYIHRIDSVLSEPQKKKYFYYIQKFALTIASSYTLFIVDMVFWYVNTKDHARQYGILYFLPFYISYMFYVIFLVQYWFISDVIKRRVVSLRKQVEHTKRELVETRTDGDHFVQKMTDLVTGYQYFQKSVHFTNLTFGLPIAVMFFNLLLHQVFVVYNWLTEIFFLRRLSTIITLTVWTVTYWVILFEIVRRPEDITMEVAHISSEVAEMLSLDIGDRLREKLDTFSANLTYQPIRFSANGLFDIDRKIVTSMASVITTYIVILMQFSISQHS